MSVGYLPNSFDLFNVAHLDLIEAARARCDSLVVAVLDDEEVRVRTGRPAVVPLDERVEIVANVRGVDSVVVHDPARVPAADVVLVPEAEVDDWPGSTGLPAPRVSQSPVLRRALRPVAGEAVA